MLKAKIIQNFFVIVQKRNILGKMNKRRNVYMQSIIAVTYIVEIISIAAMFLNIGKLRMGDYYNPPKRFFDNEVSLEKIPIVKTRSICTCIRK